MQPSFWMEIGCYLLALVNWWTCLFTGGVIIAAVTWGHTWKGVQMTRKFLIGLSIVFFVMAGFKAWEGERLKVRSTSPNLVASVDQLISGWLPEFDDGKGGSPIILNLSIRNLGQAASIAENFNLSLVSPFNMQAKHVVFLDKFPFHSNNSNFIIHRSETIDEKSIVPIAPGGLIRGWIVFVIPGFNLDNFKDRLDLVVSFQDINRTNITVHYKPYSGQPGLTPLPGTEFPLQK